MRPYVVAGASFLTDDSLPISGNVNGIGFSAVQYLPTAVARIEAGMQFYKARDWDAKLEYLLSAADSYLDHSIGLRAAKYF
jgi:hypothetical protein